jgi:hypothetical protein
MKTIYYYELVTGMEKDIHASHKGQGAATNREKKDRVSLGQGRALQQLFNLCSNSPCCLRDDLLLLFWFIWVYFLFILNI